MDYREPSVRNSRHVCQTPPECRSLQPPEGGCFRRDHAAICRFACSGLRKVRWFGDSSEGPEEKQGADPMRRSMFRIQGPAKRGWLTCRTSEVLLDRIVVSTWERSSVSQSLGPVWASKISSCVSWYTCYIVRNLWRAAWSTHEASR